MTQHNPIADKLAAFTPLECVEKAIEEAREYVDELVYIKECLTHHVHFMYDSIERMFREAADVHISGYATLSKIWPEESQAYHDKISHALNVQIPEAIAAKSDADITARVQANLAAGKFPGEGLLGDDDGDA